MVNKTFCGKKRVKFVERYACFFCPKNRKFRGSTYIHATGKLVGYGEITYAVQYIAS
jgi:hypothetical protein